MIICKEAQELLYISQTRRVVILKKRSRAWEE